MEAQENSYYIDNKKFFREIEGWKEIWNEANDNDEELPPVTEYMGECFMKISKNLCYRHNFINYTFRDDFISDGIETCLLYAHNFDPLKSKNPFSYFTQLIYFAFVRRINKEFKQTQLKKKIIDHSNAIENLTTITDIDNKKYLEKQLSYLKSFYE